MNPKTKARLRQIFVNCCQYFGSDIIDAQTGEKIGRALLVPWKGRILLLGSSNSSIIPTFLPQERLTYWKQELGFTQHPAPDFPKVSADHTTSKDSR